MNALFLDRLAGLLNVDSHNFRDQFGDNLPWLRREIDGDGPAFLETGWTADYARKRLREYEIQGLARLAERLQKGQFNVRDAISAWMILRRERAGLVTWGELKFTPANTLKAAIKTIWRTIWGINRRTIIRLGQHGLSSADLQATFPNVTDLNQYRQERLTRANRIRNIRP